MPLVLDGTTGFSGGGGVATSTALGSSALFTNSTGTNLVAIGYQAGYFTTAGPNVFVGSQAGYTNSTGTSNVGLGYQALYSNTTGPSNTAVGYQAGYTNSTGQLNVAVGALSLYNNTADSNNAFGYNSLNKTTSGGSNSAFGHASAYNNITGSSNVAVGHTALFSNTTASNNTAVGYQALYSSNRTADTAANNTAVGYQAGYSSTSSTTNVFIGFQAGYYNTTGNSNVMIGSNAGALSVNATTGDANIYIGGGVRGAGATNNNEIVIGYLTTGKGSQTGFINPNGSGVFQGNNSANWSTTSDRRLKKNIVDNTEGLNIISAVRVRNFEYRLPEEITELEPTDAVPNIGVQLGVIAQELQEVCPDCVKTESTGVLSVDSDNLTWHMINAIKELKALVDAQSALITGQAAEIVALKAKVGL